MLSVRSLEGKVGVEYDSWVFSRRRAREGERESERERVVELISEEQGRRGVVWR